MLDKNKILNYKQNIWSLLINLEGAKKHSTSKVLKKIKVETDNSIIVSKEFETLLSENISLINDALDNNASIICHKDFNPLINNTSVKISFNDNELENDFIKITKANLEEHIDNLEKLLAVNSLVNPFIEVEGANNEIIDRFITNKINIIKEIIQQNFGQLYYLIDSLSDNLRIDFDDVLDGFKEKININVEINKSFYQALQESAVVFPKLIGFINKNFLLNEQMKVAALNILKYRMEMVDLRGGMNYSLVDISMSLQKINMKNQDIENIFLGKNITNSFLIIEYAKQFNDPIFKSFIQKNFSINWLDRFNDHVFERYCAFDGKESFYGYFNKNGAAEIIKRYSESHMLEDAIEYKKVSDTHDGVAISIKELSKRVCSNTYEKKLDLFFESFIDGKKIKVTNNKMHIHISYPKEISNKNRDVLTYGLIEYLMEIREDKQIMNKTNYQVSERIDGRLEQLVRMISLNQVLDESNVSLDKEDTKKKKKI